jgi:peptide/nickel transport system substrate-binding protein
MLGWTGDNGDPDNFLYVFFGRFDKENTWDNKQARDLIARAQTTTDQKERERIYKEVATIIYNEVPRLPVAHTTPPLLFRKNVEGYVAHPTATEQYKTVMLK